MLSFATAAYAAKRNPTHIAIWGYGVANIANRKAPPIKVRKLCSDFGNHTVLGYLRALNNLFLIRFLVNVLSFYERQLGVRTDNLAALMSVV